MMKLISYFLLLLLISCTSKKESTQNISKTDILYEYRNRANSAQIIKRSDALVKTDNYFKYSYTFFFKNSEITQELKLPKIVGKSFDGYKLIEIKKFKVNGAWHDIYKYYYNLGSSEDEEKLVFLFDKSGILLEKIFFGSSQIVQISDSLEDDSIICGLVESIRADKSFWINQN